MWSLSLTAFSVVLLAKRNLATATAFSPPMFLPLISAMTLGTTGGLLATYGDGISADMAVPVIVVSYMVLGFAFFLALVYYALLAHTLFAAGLPPPGKLPALMIAVGPLGQFATAIQGLSAAASQRGMFARYDEGVWLTGGAAASVSAATVLLALLVLGFAFLWISVTWYVVLEAGVRRTLAFGLSWWSLIFPMGELPFPIQKQLMEMADALDRGVYDGAAESQYCAGLAGFPRPYGGAAGVLVHRVLCQLGWHGVEDLAGCGAGDTAAERGRGSAGEGQEGKNGPVCCSKWSWAREWGDCMMAHHL